MVKPTDKPDKNVTPSEFPEVSPPVDIFSMTDIRVVLIQQQKLTTQVEHLADAVRTTHSDFKELRNWIIGVLALGIGAVVWANGKFEDHAKQLSELNKSVAVMQEQASSTHDDIKNIKDVLSEKPVPKTVP